MVKECSCFFLGFFSEGMTCLQPEDVKNKYLLGVMATRKRGQSSSCGCPGKKVVGSLIATDTSNLSHCSCIRTEKTSGKKCVCVCMNKKVRYLVEFLSWGL